MTDLKGMTIDELHNLQKELSAEMQKRERTYKSSIGLYGRLLFEFEDELKAKGLNDNEIMPIIARYEKAILALCDFTMNNYKIIQLKNAGKYKEKKIYANGAIIDYGITDVDLYVKMADDIFSVIKKYHKKEEKDDD